MPISPFSSYVPSCSVVSCLHSDDGSAVGKDVGPCENKVEQRLAGRQKRWSAADSNRIDYFRYDTRDHKAERVIETVQRTLLLASTWLV